MSHLEWAAPMCCYISLICFIYLDSNNFHSCVSSFPCKVLYWAPLGLAGWLMWLNMIPEERLGKLRYFSRFMGEKHLLRGNKQRFDCFGWDVPKAVACLSINLKVYVSDLFKLWALHRMRSIITLNVIYFTYCPIFVPLYYSIPDNTPVRHTHLL